MRVQVVASETKSRLAFRLKALCANTGRMVSTVPSVKLNAAAYEARARRYMSAAQRRVGRRGCLESQVAPRKAHRPSDGASGRGVARRLHGATAPSARKSARVRERASAGQRQCQHFWGTPKNGVASPSTGRAVAGCRSGVACRKCASAGDMRTGTLIRCPCSDGFEARDARPCDAMGTRVHPAHSWSSCFPCSALRARGCHTGTGSQQLRLLIRRAADIQTTLDSCGTRPVGVHDPRQGRTLGTTLFCGALLHDPRVLYKGGAVRIIQTSPTFKKVGRSPRSMPRSLVL